MIDRKNPGTAVELDDGYTIGGRKERKKAANRRAETGEADGVRRAALLWVTKREA